MKKFISGFFVLIATIIIFFEEWLWFRLLKVMNAITSLPILRSVETILRRQNKWVSLAVFIIPELSFIPVKLGVVWLMGNKHAFFGVILFIAAKLTGTALFAWMWEVTSPKITEFKWVCIIRDTVIRVRTWAHDWIRSQPMYHKVHEMIRLLKTKKEHWTKRKLRAAMILSKQK